MALDIILRNPSSVFNIVLSSSGPPVKTITNYTRDKISDEVGYDESTVTFQCDQAISAWEARATTELQTPAQGVGLLVGDGTSVSANTDIVFVVDDEELTNGDRIYQITVYVQVGGVWY